MIFFFKSAANLTKRSYRNAKEVGEINELRICRLHDLDGKYLSSRPEYRRGGVVSVAYMGCVLSLTQTTDRRSKALLSC